MTSRSTTLLTLIAGAPLTFSAPAVAAPPGKPVLVSGCPTMGSPSVCTEMRRGNTTYNVSAATPAAPIGKFILLLGRESQAPSFCRGIVLQNIQWREIPGACPPAPKM
jgi:hypothetical protein